MRVVYMGTPEFAVAPLQAMIDAGHEVAAVITQPDKAKGRGKKLQPTPVKEKALEHNIPVYQPEKVKAEDTVELLKSLKPQVIVVAAYGQILPESILNIPEYGCINIHASLLPKYRGAAPIEWAIIDGEEKTGVTTMYMEKGLDTGDMLDKVELAIEPEETGQTLHDKLARVGAELILVTLKKLEDKTASREKQDSSASSYAVMLKKEMGKIDFTQSAESIERRIRGLIPWPCAYTTIDGKVTQIHSAQVKRLQTSAAPGEIIEVTKKYFVIACGEDALIIRSLKPEGKKVMDAAAYLNGNKLEAGMTVG